MTNLLDKRIVIWQHQKNFIARVIGIDDYALQNYEGRTRNWRSYTLVPEDRSAFDRCWITNWRQDGWVFWTPAKKRKSLKLPVVTNRSGLSTIKFLGDQGASTPYSSVILFLSGRNTYYAMERFADSSVMFFDAQRIKRPRVIAKA